MPDTVWALIPVARFKRTLPVSSAGADRVAGLSELSSAGTSPFFSNIDHCFIGEFCAKLTDWLLASAVIRRHIIASWTAIGAQLIDTWLFDGSFDTSTVMISGASDTEVNLSSLELVVCLFFAQLN